MPINKNFSHYGTLSEQNLLRDLVMEMIEQFGMEVYYLPRTPGNVDDLLGEDPLSYYEKSVQLPVYVESAENWGGTGELISKFTGLTFDEKLTITISQVEWSQMRSQKLYFETNDMIMYEDGSLFTLKDGLTLNSADYVLPNVPKENDLIFIPTMNRIFVINHVNRDERFFPLGVLTVYTLTVGAWDYSSERLATNVNSIDFFGENFSTNLLADTQRDANNVITVVEQPNTTPVHTVPQALEFDFFSNNVTVDAAANSAIIWTERDPRSGKRIF